MEGLKELEDEILKVRRRSEVYVISPRDVEYYSKCMHLREEVANLLSRVETNLAEVMKAIKNLQPFARKRTIVELWRGENYSDVLVVGYSIYTTWTYQDAKAQCCGRRMPSIHDMFNAILKYKDKIVPLLRKSIKSDFLEIVESVEEMQRSRRIEICREGSFRIWEVGRGRIGACYADKICMYAENRFWDIYYFSRGRYLGCGSVYRLDNFFEVYDVVYDILSEAHQRLVEELRKSEEKLKRIKEIVAPYALAKKL